MSTSTIIRTRSFHPLLSHIGTKTSKSMSVISWSSDHLHPTSNMYGPYRSFSKKASKMGKHLEKLEELAHRSESEKAKEKKMNPTTKHNPQTLSNQDESHTSSSDDEEDLSSIFHGHNTNSDTLDPSHITLPSKEEVKDKMMKVVHAMEAVLRSIRGAEPSPELFDAVPVKVYGSIMPLNAVAQVVISGPSMATITCFDPATVSAVRDAIRDMEGMNFNPRMEDHGTLMVPIPKVSIETRKSIVKQLNKIAEDNRQRIRRIRRAAQDLVKKGKDGHVKGISKDDAFRVGNQVDDVTEECIKAVNEIVDKKTASVLSI